jgi:hypothetical protein
MSGTETTNILTATVILTDVVRDLHLTFNDLAGALRAIKGSVRGASKPIAIRTSGLERGVSGAWNLSATRDSLVFDPEGVAAEAAFHIEYTNWTMTRGRETLKFNYLVESSPIVRRRLKEGDGVEVRDIPAGSQRLDPILHNATEGEVNYE